MAGNYFSNPSPQWFDDNGDPLNLGTVEFFEAGGTTTPLDTFTDKDLTPGNENTNPLPLDSDGRSTTNVFLQQLAYNIVVKDSAGATIPNATRDNVSNITQIDVTGTATVDTYAALTALLKATLSDGTFRQVNSRDTRGDIEPVLFEFVSASTATANAGTILTTDEGGTGRWLMRFLGPVNAKWFGAKGDSVTDDTTAIQAAINEGTYLVSPGTYKITASLTFTGGTVGYWDNVVIDKAFNGEGLVFTGGSIFNEIHGNLTVDKLTFNAGTGLVASNDATDHGVVFRGNRIRQFGTLFSRRHQGNGILFDATGNANGSYYEFLQSFNNNSRGIGTAGTNDNSSVWTIKISTSNNFTGGIRLEDTYPARSWFFDFFNQEGGQDGASAGIRLGGMTRSIGRLYSEENISVGNEVEIAATTLDTHIWLSRANTVNNLGARVVTFLGGRQFGFGGTPNEGLMQNNNVTDQITQFIEKIWQGSSVFELFRRRILGTGTIQWKATKRSDSTTTTFEILPGNGIQVDGNLIEQTATAAADDTTPSVKGIRTLLIPTNTIATAITQLDDGVANQTVRIILTSATNPSTIADSGNFKLSAAFTPTIDDHIQLFTTNGTTWTEDFRSAN